MSKRKSQERMTLFDAGDWVRKRRQQAEEDISQRARAERLALLGVCQQQDRHLREPPSPLAI